MMNMYMYSTAVSGPLSSFIPTYNYWHWAGIEYSADARQPCSNACVYVSNLQFLTGLPHILHPRCSLLFSLNYSGGMPEAEEGRRALIEEYQYWNNIQYWSTFEWARITCNY